MKGMRMRGKAKDSDDDEVESGPFVPDKGAGSSASSSFSSSFGATATTSSSPFTLTPPTGFAALFSPKRMRDLAADRSINALDIILALVLLMFSWWTRLHVISHPRGIVFDEAHFTKFINMYVSGSYFMDIHPPLAKLIMSRWLAYFGYTGFPDGVFNTTPGFFEYYENMRISTAVMSGLVIPILYFALRCGLMGRIAAFFGAWLFCFDNLVVLESRLVLTDGYLLLFNGLTILSTLALSRQRVYSRGWIFWIFATGVSLGCVISVKFTALGCLGFVGCHQLYLLFKSYIVHAKQFAHMPKIQIFFAGFVDAAVRGIVILGVAATILYITFIFHIRYLPYRGEGDPFMTQEWRNSLVDKPKNANEPGRLPPRYLPQLSMRQKISELIYTMWTSNLGLRAPHPGGSYWYEWPLMRNRLVHYWGGPLNTQHVSSVGNPAVWYLVVLCLLIYLGLAAYSVLFMMSRKRTHAVLGTEGKPLPLAVALGVVMRKRVFMGGLLFIGYVGNWAPFQLIKRVCFNYHYLPALMMGTLMCAFVIDVMFKTLEKRRSPRYRFFGYVITAGLMAIVVWTFLHFAPWTYGTTTTVEEQRTRLWISEWYPNLE